MPSCPAVAHVGPDPSYPGGIASVITVLRDHQVGGEAVVIVSWAPGSRGARVRQMLRAAWQIARLPRETLVHLHMAALGSVPRKGALLIVARATGHRAVVTIHGSRFEQTAEQHPRLVRAVLRRANLLLVLTPQMRAIAQRVAPGVPVHLFSNPVEVDSAPSPAGGRAPLVVFAGEVGLRKGADVLAAAWPKVREQVPGAQLKVAGLPTELAADPGAGAELLGPLPRGDVRTLLREARVVALPSRAEALPMVLLEAMGCGTPIVGTPVGDVSRLTGTGAGTLVDVGDAEALSDAIVALLSDDAAATTAGLAGWNACRERYSVEALARETERRYAEARA